MLSRLGFGRSSSTRPEAELPERLCVFGLCYNVVDTYCQIAANDKLLSLYDNLAAPYTGWEGRVLLTSYSERKRARTSLQVWNQFFWNYLRLMRVPDAALQVGAFIANPLVDWGTIRPYSHAVVRIGTPKDAYSTTSMRIGNDECNGNKFWKLVRSAEARGRGQAMLRMRYRFPGENYPNRDIPSLDFITGILRAVPLMFPNGVLADSEILQAECEILPYLAYYRELMRICGTKSQIEEFHETADGTLVINDEAYGKRRLLWGRNVMEIRRDLEFGGPQQLVLKSGMHFGADGTIYRVDYQYQELPFSVRLGHTVDYLKYTYLNRVKPDPNRPVPAIAELNLTTAHYADTLAQQDQQRENVKKLFYQAHPEKAEAEIRRWTDMAECKSQMLPGHMSRTGRVTALLARYYNFLELAAGRPALFIEEQIARFEKGGQIHDVGKIFIPDWILLAQRKLNDAERTVMNRHAELGFGIATDIGLDDDIAQIVQCHHLQYGGEGYPKRIVLPNGEEVAAPVGDDIPLQIQFASIGDVFDAIRWREGYKRRFTEEEARAEVEGMARRYNHFNMRLVQNYWRVRDDGLAILEVQEIEVRERTLGYKVA